MYCSNCGAQSPDDAIFCFRCGTKLVNKEIGHREEINFEYAGFWRRLAALVIDGIILTISYLLISSLFGFKHFSLVIVIWIIGYWLYFTLYESSKKMATLGKMALEIMVTDANGNQINFGRANARFWSKILSNMIMFAGYIMAGITDKKQALHDVIADTLVILKK
jgi:uncharacterized RDD family membrane protein YckC